MSDYFYHSANKNTYSEHPTYLASGQKSYNRTQTQGYLERTPDRKQAFSAKKGNRLSSAHRSIEDCFQMVAEKKQMNQQAFDQVKNVNHQLLGSFSWLNPVKANVYQPRNKTTEQYRRDSSRQNIAVSQFQWNPYTPQRLHQSQYRPIPSLEGINQQNSDLRNKLNNEMRKNNQLLRQITHLQYQVTELKASNQHSNQSGSIKEILQQNQSLRNQLANSQLGENYDLIKELERLKSQNSELRKDTINLLKSRPY